MTFIRAQLTASGPTILSDWYVTDPAAIKPASFKSGTLKVLRLNAQVCVAFAGHIERCLRAIEAARGSLVAGHIEGGNEILRAATESQECEFLLTTIEPSQIYEIKKGATRSCTSAWLGDHRAFEAYQKAASLAKAANSDDSAIANDAFAAVIDSGEIDGVGLLTVRVIATPLGFEYAASMSVVGGFTPQVIPSDTWTTITWGGAHDGAFAVSVMGASDHAAVGIYFPHGGFGLLSAPLDIQDTVAVDSTMQTDFIEKVSSIFGISLQPGIELT